MRSGLVEAPQRRREQAEIAGDGAATTLGDVNGVQLFLGQERVVENRRRLRIAEQCRGFREQAHPE